MNDHSVRPSFATATRQKRRSRRPLIFTVCVVLAVVSAVAYWFWSKESAPDQSIASLVVERGDVEENVTALGNLQPRDYVDVGAQVSGQLRKIHFGIGDRVEQGELLAEIDASVQQARVEAGRAQLLGLQAQLAERRAQLDLSEQLFQRQKRLKQANATSEESYQTSLASVRINEAQIAALKAQIQQVQSTLKGDEATLGYTKIFAPMAGTIVSLSAREGQTLNANQQAPIILRIADLSTMTVWTQVSEADVSKLKEGMAAYFSTLGSPNRRWTGTLRQILPTPEVLNNVVLYTALFDVENPRQELMTQMSAQVFFQVAFAADVVTVPMAALRPIDRKAGQYEVTVVGAEGTYRPRPVQIGVSNRVVAEVVSGLEPGERILATAPRSSSGRGNGGERPQTRLRGL